jgi:hypothetical protein
MKASKRNMHRKLLRYAKKAKLRKNTGLPTNEEITLTFNTSNDQDNKDNLCHDESMEISYNPDKVI